MNVVIVQEEAIPLVQELGIRCRPCADGLYAVDAIELSAGLCLHAVQAGAVILNLITAEDVRIRNGRLDGVVANRSLIVDSLPVDPIVFSAHAVLDATGHEAVLVESLRKRRLLKAEADCVEGPMDCRRRRAVRRRAGRRIIPRPVD